MPKRPKRDLWVIEFESPDSSQCFTNAYPSKEKAVAAAVAFIEYTAKDELEGIDWDEPEAPALLKAALDAIKSKKFDDAIMSWLEYQGDFDPQEKISIGPSGSVSDSPHDYAYHVGK